MLIWKKLKKNNKTLSTNNLLYHAYLEKIQEIPFKFRKHANSLSAKNEQNRHYF